MLITTNHWRLVWLQALLDGKEVEAGYLADLKVSAGLEKLAERQERVTLADLEQASGHDPRQRRVQAALEVMRGNLSGLALPARFTILTPYVRNPSRKQAGWVAGFDYFATGKAPVFRHAGLRIRAFGWTRTIDAGSMVDFLYRNIDADLALPATTGGSSGNFHYVLARGGLDPAPEGAAMTMREQVARDFESCGLSQVAATVRERTFK